MAFTPLESTSETKSSGGFVPLEQPTAPTTSASAPVEGGGGAAFGVYPKPGMQPTKEGDASVLGTIATRYPEAALAARAGLSAARYGAAVTPPVTPWAKPVGGIVAGVAGSIAASYGINSVEEELGKLVGFDVAGLKRQQEQQQPGVVLASQVAGGGINPWMRPGVPSNLKEAGLGIGLQLGIGAGSRAATGQDVLDPKSLVADVAGAFSKPTARGMAVLGQPVAKTTPKDTTTPPPPIKEPVVTPEQKTGFVKKLEGESKSPLVETAIKNKKTGEIERLGPKHNEARKAETKDTHEQGFVDEAGNFLNRKDAWNRAQKVGQIPKDQLPEFPNEGLHSGDLRKAGDKRFAIDRDKYKADIAANEAQRMSLEAQAEEAARVGDEARVTSINEQIKKLETEHAQLTKDMPSQEKLAYERDDVQEYADRHSTTTESTKDAFVDWLYKNEKPLDPDKIEGYERQFMSEGEGKPKAELIEPVTWETLKPGQQVTLYRGEDKNVSGGEWWTTKKDVAAKFGNVTEVTLPSELVGKHSVQGHGGSHEFVFPTEGSRPTDLGAVKSISDRTKTSPRDVKNEQEMFEIAQEIYDKHGEVEAVKFYEGFREYEKTWLEPIKETEKFVGINIQNKLANERIIHNEKEGMLKSIPDLARREAVAEAVDKGDLSGLSPEEVALAKKYEALVKDIGDRAVEQGVVKGLLEDYVTHIIDWEGAPKGAREEFIQALLGTSKSDPSMQGMATTSKFAQQRKFKTFEDLQRFIDEANGRIAAAGKSDYRLKIKTKDIAEIYKEYALSMEKAIENKSLIDNLKQIRNANGESLIKEVDTKDNPKPYGWEMINSPQFAGYAAHPDLVPYLNFVFDAGPGMTMQALGAVSQFVKRFNVIGSFFHAKSLMEVMSSAGIPIWTPIKEAIVLPLVEKGVKATTGKDLKLSAISKAVEQFKNGGLGDNIDKWIKEGKIVFETPDDVSTGVLTASGKFADQMIAKFGPKTRALESTMSVVEKYTLGAFDKYTWDYLHTGGKIMVADAYLDKARLQAAKEGKPFDEVAAREQIGRFVNDSFGGLNWFDAATQANTELGKRIALAAYSPEGRRALQVALFAPDWTISTIRAFTAALPKQLNPTKWHPIEGVKGMMAPTTKADYARLYQFKTALTYFTLVNAINMMTADRPIWENKDPTRIEWPDGTSMQAMKHAMEPYHWIADPDKTLSNKLGFIPKAAIMGIGGLEYASPNAPKLVDRSALGRLEAVAKTASPFQVQAATDAPEGEGVKRAVLGTMGFPVYGTTAEQRKLANAERELATKEQAWKYRDKEIKSGRVAWTPKHDKEKQSLDKRREKINKQTGKE